MSSAQSPQYVEFASLLRRARRRARVSQKHLGERLGKPQSYISKVETCERRLDLIETVEWCAALGIALGDVVPSALRAAAGGANGTTSPTGQPL